MKESLVLALLVIAGGALVQQSAAQAAPAGQGAQAAQTQQRKVIKDPAEYNAYMNVIQQQNPAQRAQLLEAFLQSYPSSVMKEGALELLMAAYQQAGEAQKMVDTAQRVLLVNPNNVRALALLAYLYLYAASSGGPQMQDSLAKANQYGEQGLQALQNMQKPAGMSDADFAKFHNETSSIFNKAVAPATRQAKDDATAPALGAFVALPTDINCAIQDLDVKETPNGWVAKTAAGLSCSMQGRGPAGIKNVEFISKNLNDGAASTKDFGDIRFTIHGVPAMAQGKLPNGGRVAEVEYSGSPEPGLVTIMLDADHLNAFRAYLSSPTPFEASVASCSGPVAAAWPPNAKFKKPEMIWRVVNLSDCSVYYAQLIDLGIRGRAGLMMTFGGGITLTPDPGPTGVAAHVTSIDAWKPPFLIPGAKSGLHGKFTGFAALLGNPNGTVRQEQPELQPGQGYEDVSFKDLGSKKRISFSKFIADTMGSDKAAAPPLKD